MKKKIWTLVVLISMLCIIANDETSVFATTNGYSQEQAVKFIESMVGKKYDVDNNGSYDCVDLAKEYFHVVGGENYKARGNGEAYARCELPNGWTRNYLDDGYIPQPGDCVAWAATGGWAPYGHVALVLSVSNSNKTITVVEQSTSRQIPASKATYKWSSPTCYNHPDFDNNTITSAKGISHSEITIKWSKVTNATKYTLQRRKAGASGYSNVKTGITNRSYTDSNLETGQRYYYKVIAYNGSIKLSESESVGVYTKSNPPTVTTATSGKLKITWGSISYAESYTIMRRKSGDDEYDEIKTVNDTSYVDSGLSSNTQYYYWIQANCNVNGEEMVCKSTTGGQITAPDAPKITGIDDTSKSEITIKWNAVPGASSYRVEHRKAGTDTTSYGTVVQSTTDTSFTDGGLVSGERYYYKVYASNAGGESSASSVVGGYTKFNEPNVATLNTTELNVEWGGISAAQNYTVRRRRYDGEYADIATVGGTSYKDTGLEPATKYYYWIRANCRVDGTAYTAKSTTSEQFTKLPAPNASADDSAVNLSWQNMRGDNAYIYRIMRKEANSSEYPAEIATIAETSYRDVGIKPNTTYYYYIDVLRSDGSWCTNSDGINATVNSKYTVLNIGDDFNAYINYTGNGMYITRDADSNVTSRSYSGSNNQIWHFIRQSDNSYRIESTVNVENNVLDLANYGTAPETNVGTTNYNTVNDSAQRWYIIEHNGAYRIKPACSECVLDVQGGFNDEGTNIQTYTWLEEGAQDFYINKINSENVLKSKAAVYNGHFYQSYYVPGLTWSGANTYAQKLGGHLVTISDEKENEFIKREMFIEGKEFFIGLNDVWNEGNFTWSNGEGVTYTNWTEGEPNNTGNNEDAVHIRSNGEWNDVNANTANDAIGFIVEYEPQVESEFEYNGHKYQVYSVAPTWNAAKEYCEQLGGNLAAITSAEENEAIANHLKQEKNYYLGAYLDKSINTWRWVTNEGFNYANWNDGEPNNTNNNENVIEMYSSGKWNDAADDLTRGFICKINLESKLTFDRYELSIEADAEYQLETNIYPPNAADGKIIWSSSDEEVAMVSDDGLIHALKKGNAVITATVSINGVEKTAECEVSVVVTPASISLDKSVLRLNGIGATGRLTAMVLPENAEDKTITWTTSDENVAIVSSSGLVTAKGYGTARITASTTNGKKAVCEVKVRSLIINKTTLDLNVGDTETLAVQTQPTIFSVAVVGGSKPITWTSSNPNIASVKASSSSYDATVEAKENGNAVITAATSDGFTVSCAVTVKGGSIDAPKITSINDTSKTEITLKWSASSGATSYRVDRRQAGDDKYITVKNDTDSTQFTDRGLEPGQRYYYRVCAIGSGTTAMSETIGGCTKFNEPKIESFSENSIELSWDEMVDADSYTVRRRRYDGEYEDYATVKETSFTDTNVEIGTKYYYWIRANCRNGSEEYVVKSTTSGQFTKLASPSLQTSENSVQLQWEKANGKDAYTYRIMRKASGEPNYTELATTSEISFVDESVKSNMAYSYYIDVLTGNDFCVSSGVAATSNEVVTLGDVNGDGEVDIADAILIMNHDAGISKIDDRFIEVADVNKDGEVDVADAILLMKYDAGLITEF